jgi:type II secretory pathway component PulF
MNAFRYQAIEDNGSTVQGVIEAEDRKVALQLLGKRGLFPSSLETCASPRETLTSSPAPASVAQAKGRLRGSVAPPSSHAPASFAPVKGVASPAAGMRLGTGIKRKEITAFTREMGALLGAGIPIPQALDGLGEEEENSALRTVVLQIGQSVRKGVSLSAAMEEQPRLFSKR